MNSPFQRKIQNVPKPQLPTPSFPKLLLFLMVLGWLAVSPVLVSGVTSVVPHTWPHKVSTLLALGLTTGLLFPPLIGLAGLTRRQHWHNLWPFAVALLVTGLYIIVLVLVRAVIGPIRAGHNLSFFTVGFLPLIGLTLVALGLGGVSLRQTGVPRRFLLAVLGFNRPSLTGLVTALALIALLTIGWPITGALGDRWISALILLQVLAIVLPEEILFRGAVLGLLTFNFQQRKALAALIALLIYVAYTPSLILPRHDWGKLMLLVGAIPYALLITELRALTGSIWAGVLLAWAYRSFPTLFTDPRVEFPLITQPWQTGAYVWMILGAGGLALVMLGGRRWLKPGWPLSGLATASLALGTSLILWSLWMGLWFGLGRPGFYDDGFLIILAEQADLTGAEDIDDIIARRAYVRDQLIETAARTQAPVREALQAAGLEYRSFYLINMIRVAGHHRQMSDFAEMPGVAKVMLNPNVRPYPLRFDIGYGTTPDEGQGIEWNISQTRAEEVWAMGITGQGIVVAGQDTGYNWQHPALRHAYRGNNESGQANHAYNWHDAWSDTAVPFDDDQHGTHTMGTIVGDDGQGNQIGMAPGARWIGCRNMRRGLGNPASYTDCLEFFLAPYPTGGDPVTDGDVSMAPHIINNSWGCPDIEGCNDAVLEPAALALRAAGIMMVVSAGNSGPACQSVAEPPARYNSVFSVGATNDNGLVTGFSSRGPVVNDVKNDVGTTNALSLLKPDVVAPGVDVRSSLARGGYGIASGTSMAGPHVSGLVALLWSANPHLIGQIDATEEIIRQTARPVAVNTPCSLASQRSDVDLLLDELESLNDGNACACGDVVGNPNNVYGWGEIDALEGVKMTLEMLP